MSLDTLQALGFRGVKAWSRCSRVLTWALRPEPQVLFDVHIVIVDWYKSISNHLQYLWRKHYWDFPDWVETWRDPRGYEQLGLPDFDAAGDDLLKALTPAQIEGRRAALERLLRGILATPPALCQPVLWEFLGQQPSVDMARDRET